MFDWSLFTSKCFICCNKIDSPSKTIAIISDTLADVIVLNVLTLRRQWQVVASPVLLSFTNKEKMSQETTVYQLQLSDDEIKERVSEKTYRLYQSIL